MMNFLSGSNQESGFYLSKVKRISLSPICIGGVLSQEVYVAFFCTDTLLKKLIKEALFLVCGLLRVHSALVCEYESS